MILESRADSRLARMNLWSHSRLSFLDTSQKIHFVPSRSSKLQNKFERQCVPNDCHLSSQRHEKFRFNFYETQSFPLEAPITFRFLLGTNTNPHAGISLQLLSRENNDQTAQIPAALVHTVCKLCASVSLIYLGCCKSNPRQSQNKQTVPATLATLYVAVCVLNKSLENICTSHYSQKTHQKTQKLENFI